jgi:hypothetical protein
MVTAVLPDEDTRKAYVAWMQGGHLAQVVQAGAISAQLVAVDDPARPLEVCSIYTFPSRESFDVYLRDHAPRLRADGLSRFGAQTGVKFRRQVGTILA